MGKAVLHFEKHGKATSGSLGNHIDRTEGKEYSYRHADLSRTKNNAYIKVNKYCSMDYNQAILQRVEDGYQARNKAGELKAIRKDAVYSINAVLSGTHEELKDIEKDPEKMQKWIEKNLDFCKKHFGEDNITRFAVHLDEKTPHIHCVFVPITADGRLSANDIIGTGKKLEEFQTLYAKEMADFGLERGVKSERKHHTTEEYRRRERYKLDENKDILNAVEELRQSDVFGFKAKKEALFSMLENLITKTDETTKKEIEALKSTILSLENDKRLLHAKKNEYIVAKKYIDDQTKQTIFDGFNLVDYFFSLVNRGILNYSNKSGNEFYFTDRDRKFSVNANGKGYFDHKSGVGGQKVRAVMQFEKIDWYGAMNFMNSFHGTDMSHLYDEIKEDKKFVAHDETYINTILTPNNEALLGYFKTRLISEEVLKKYAKQVHYQDKNGSHFGIGLKNVLGGWDIRSAGSKRKIGKSSYTEIGNGDNLTILEGMTDFFTMVEILKASNRPIEEYKFIVLNSTTNVDKFILDFKDWDKDVYTILDAGTAGNEATKKIGQYFREKSRDLRHDFGIGIDEHNYSDLNDSINDITNLHRMHKLNENSDKLDKRLLDEKNDRPKFNFKKR